MCSSIDHRKQLFRLASRASIAQYMPCDYWNTLWCKQHAHNPVAYSEPSNKCTSLGFPHTIMSFFYRLLFMGNFLVSLSGTSLLSPVFYPPFKPDSNTFTYIYVYVYMYVYVCIPTDHYEVSYPRPHVQHNRRSWWISSFGVLVEYFNRCYG